MARRDSEQDRAQQDERNPPIGEDVRGIGDEEEDAFDDSDDLDDEAEDEDEEEGTV